MSNFSLYSRMREHGTISEIPSDVPDAKFALPSTIHWIKALKIVTETEKLNFSNSKSFYAAKHVQKRNMSDKEYNSVFEQLLFSLHQIASLQAISKTENKADVARIGIVSWYYGIYGAASAMISACDGSFPDNHTATANQWDRNFPCNNLALNPFAYRISNLLDSTIKVEMEPIRVKGKCSLTTKPVTEQDAWGCIAEYLSGTSTWEQWNIKERVKSTKEFKLLNVSNFRSTDAQNLRDEAFKKKSVSFLHQAFRYRGKANYRDAIYLAYGKGVPKLLESFIDDLAIVLIGFTSMAGAYCSLRIGNDLWDQFLNDLEDKKSISISPKSIWS